MIPEQLICECRHDPEEHLNRRQHCRGIDSYGVVCTCQSYEEMSDGDSDDGAARPRPSCICPEGGGPHAIWDLGCRYRCCDLHNQHCEPPSDLCCYGCAEVGHPRHPVGIPCVLEVDR